MINNDGVLTFKTSDGKYLYADGTDVKLVDTEGDNTKFVLESTNDDGTNFYIRCNTAQSYNKAQYLEYYYNYITCYGLNASNAGIYVFGLYELAENTGSSESSEPSETPEPSEPTPSETPAPSSSSTGEGGDEPVEAEYVALFNPASQSLVSVEPTTFVSDTTSKEELELIEGGLIQDETSEAEGKFTAKDHTKAEKVALFEVIENDDEDKTVSFKTKDGKYLYADGKDVKLVDAVSKDGHTDFIKEEVKMTPEGSSEAEVLGYHLKCSKATIDGKAQYLETFKGCLTVYGNKTYTDLENGKPEEDNYLFDWNALHVCEHAYAKDTDKGADASCTEPGEKVFICSKCKFSYANEIPALGHKDKNGDGKCDREGCGEDMPTTATVYTKVTANQTDWSGTYLIAYMQNATTARVFNGEDSNNQPTATVSNNTIFSSTNTSITSCEMIVAKSGSGYTIKVVAGTNKDKYLAKKGENDNGIKFNTSGTALSISLNSSGYVVIKDGNNPFMFNKTSGQNRFRFFKSTTSDSSIVPEICLFKLN